MSCPETVYCAAGAFVQLARKVAPATMRAVPSASQTMILEGQIVGGVILVSRSRAAKTVCKTVK